MSKRKVNSPVTSFSRYVTKKIFKTEHYTQLNNVQKATVLRNVSNLIGRIKKHANASDKNIYSKINSIAVKQATQNGLIINFKRNELDDVYIFLMSLFADYNHDIGSISNINKKMNISPNKSGRNCRGLVTSMDNRMVIFRKWVCKITWLNPAFKDAILDLIDRGIYADILTQSFGPRGTKINEYIFVKGIFKQYMIGTDTINNNNNSKVRRYELPFIIVSPSDVWEAAGSSDARISFDQSSRSSAPAMYKSLSGENKTHTFDIALPFLADKGSEQTSNPLLDFIKYVREYIDVGINPNGTANNKMTNNNVRGERKRIFDTHLKKFIINDNDVFKISFQHKGVPFFEYQYEYDNNADIKLRFNTFGQGNGNMVGSASSASSLMNISVSEAIFKTSTDLGMQMYSICANSIYASGDRAAGTIMMLLTYMYSRNLIKFNLGFPRFVFEVDTSHVIVPYDTFFRSVKLTNKNGHNIRNNTTRQNAIKRQKNIFLQYLFKLNSPTGRIPLFIGRGRDQRFINRRNVSGTTAGNSMIMGNNFRHVPNSQRVNVPIVSEGPGQPMNNNNNGVTSINQTINYPRETGEFQTYLKPKPPPKATHMSYANVVKKTKGGKVEKPPPKKGYRQSLRKPKLPNTIMEHNIQRN